MKSLELKIPPVVVLAVAIVITLLVRTFVGGWLPVHTFIPGIAFIIGGIMTALSAVQIFRAVSTTVDPRDPNKTEVLVQRGIFDVSRNPMYLGMVLFQLGLALCLNSLTGVLLVPLMMMYLTRFQIIPEERYMQEKFGHDYALYCKHTRRWLGRYR